MRKVLQSAAALSAIALFARMLGPLKNILIADRFGISRRLDAFFLAANLIDVFVSSVGFTVIIIVVPAFMRKSAEAASEGRSPHEAIESFIGQCILASVILGTAFAALARPLAGLVPGFEDPADRAYLVRFLMILGPSVIFSVPAAALTGLFHSQGRVVAPSCAALIAPVAVVFCLAFLAGPAGVYCLPVGVFAGHLLAAAAVVALHAARSGGFRFRYRNPDIFRRIRHSLLPAIVFSAGGHINLLVDRVVTSGLADGAVSILSYGQFLFMVPFTLITMPLVTALFPEISRRDIRHGPEQSGHLTARGFLALAWILVPMSLCVVVFRVPLVDILYRHGRFDADAVRRTAGVLLAYTPGILFLSLNALLQRLFFSRRAMHVLMVLTLISILVNAALDVLLSPVMGVTGVALATSINAAVYLLLVLTAAHTRLGVSLLHLIGRDVLRILAAAVPMVGVLLVLHHAWPLTHAANRWLAGIGVAGFSGLGFIVYVLVLKYGLKAPFVSRGWLRGEDD